MGVLEWDSLLTVRASDLGSQEREALCESVADCQVDPDASPSDLRGVLTLAQSLLTFRGEQVERLRGEMDEMAAKHLDSQEELRQQLSEQTSVGKKSRKAAEARQEVVRLQRQNRELQTELEVLRQQQRKTNVLTDPEEEEERAAKEQRRLNKSLELQTGHIARLLADLEGVEAENEVLKERLASVRDKLAQATEGLAESTSELTAARNLCLEYKGKCSELQGESEALRRQVNDLVGHRSQLDQQLNEFRQAVDTRVERWKSVMEAKEDEISDLRGRLMVSQPDQTTQLQDLVAQLKKTLATREQEVAELSLRLGEATQELADSVTTLEQLRTNSVDDESLRLWTQLEAAVERERALEGRLREAEQDASLRAEEVTSLTNELRRVEGGTLGLSEALAESRELRRALAVRDADIEGLVASVNKLQAGLDEAADQNAALRERLGLGSDSQLDVGGVTERRAAEKKRVEALHRQVAALEAERITLKLDKRELQRHMSGDGGLAVVPEEEEEGRELHAEGRELHAELQTLVEENESLRKGMHEILESVRTQDAASEVHVESACLERLLEALDARHVAGWYHPAMRLQAQLSTMQGVAGELREQLRLARLQEKTLRDQLLTLSERGAITEADGGRDNLPSPQPTPRVVRVKSQGGKQTDWGSSLRAQVQELSGIISELSRCMPSLAEAWQTQTEVLQTELEDAKAEGEELRRHLADGDHSVAMCAARAASQRLAERASLRQCHSLQAARTRLTSLSTEVATKAARREAQLAGEVTELRVHEAEARREVSRLQACLSASVPVSQLEESQKELAKTAATLRDLLLQQDKWGPEGMSMRELRQELAESQDQVKVLQSELAKDRCALRTLEVQSQNPDLEHQLSSLAQKLASAELGEAAANQKSEHTNRMCGLLREQVSELEGRRAELERSLLAQLAVPTLDLGHEEQQPVENTPPESSEARSERLEEALATALHQVAALQGLVDARHAELESLREQTTQLHANGDLQATIGRLSEEVLALRLAEASARSETAQSERCSVELRSRCHRLEHRLREVQREVATVNTSALDRERRTQQRLSSLCLRHSACVPLPSLDLAARWLREARGEVSEALAREARARVEANEALDKLTSVEGERSTHKVPEIEREAKELHVRGLQLKVQLLESDRRAQRLSHQLQRQTERAERLETHAHQLEDERLELEKECEKRLIAWELEQCYGTVEPKHAVTSMKQNKPVVSDPLTVVDIEEETSGEEKRDDEKPTPAEMKNSSLDATESSRVVVTKLADEGLRLTTEKLRKEVLAKERLVTQLQSQLAQQGGSRNRAKLALEAMVSSLSELVTLKEAAVSRARQRLREAHAEHAQVTRALRQQTSELREVLARVQASSQPVPGPEAPSGAVSRLLTQVHELEDELRVANRGAGVLAGQLRAANTEAQRWRDLAETRQARLQQLQDRYEAEVEGALAARINKLSGMEKAEVEVAEKENGEVSSGPELLKARQEVRNLRERLASTEAQLHTMIEETKKKIQEPPPILLREGKQEQPREGRVSQERLRAQVKALQTELEEARAREKASLEQHRAITSEGVSRWEERKRLQSSCSRLRGRLQAEEAGSSRLRHSNDALRALVERLERDKAQLELQLRKKTKKSQPVTTSNTIALEGEVARLRGRLLSSEESCAGLRRQLEHQRHLAEESARLREEGAGLRRELEREKEASLSLQGRNTRLEALNLELRLKLEQSEASSQATQEGEGMSRAELQRSVLVLGGHVRKLQAKLRARGGSSNASLDSSLESPNSAGDLAARLQAAVKRKNSLETELAVLRGENADLTDRLQQKVRVMVEVRAALQEASLREDALTAEVASLRSRMSC